MPSLGSLKWLDFFRFCRFLRVLGHVMVLFVLGIIGIVYYAVVGAVYIPKLAETRNVWIFIGCLLVIVLFSAMVVMTTWSYLACVHTDPGKVPSGWHPFADEQQARLELERLAFSVSLSFDRRDPQRPRYCRHCHEWKPERSHHCSMTGRCVLKMDHYCIWVVNCVGLLNYKFFLLFIGYALIGSVAACLLVTPPLVKALSRGANDINGRVSIMMVGALLSGAMALALIFFLGMHAQLVASNCSTIEMYEKDRIQPWPYNRGARRNFEDVFGRSKLRWFLPLYSRAERQELLDSCLDASGSRLILMESGAGYGRREPPPPPMTGPLPSAESPSDAYVLIPAARSAAAPLSAKPGGGVGRATDDSIQLAAAAGAEEGGGLSAPLWGGKGIKGLL